MEFTDYLSPLSYGISFPKGSLGESVLFNQVEKNFPDLQGVNLAIVGIEEDRHAVNNIGCGEGQNIVRHYLYQLFLGGNYTVKIADIGNIKQGHTIDDTYFAVSQVIAELIKRKIVPVIIGGSQDLTYANYKAYELLGQTVNMVAVDPMFDLGDVDSILDSRTFLGKIMMQQPNFLFNYSNIGYQTYFVDQRSINLMSKLFFDAYRLGEVRGKMEDIEPVIRHADTISFDMSSIKSSDAPGCGNATPNGFYSEEACQLAKYAGMNDKLSSIGFYEYNPKFDKNEQTAHLLAQMIWCFVDGYYNRKNDQPLYDTNGFTKYRVALKNHKYEILFYKSNKTDRWWMDVPYPSDKRIKYDRHHLVPCSYNDYVTACNEEMPDRWWQVYQKLS